MTRAMAPGYWPTILLAIAIVATAITAAFAWSALWPPPFGGASPSVLGLPSNVVLSVVAAALAVIGLAWMVRIFRGPRDEPPPWRYRDR